MAGNRDDELAETAPASAGSKPADLARTATAPASTPSSLAAVIKIGETLDRYSIEKELGSGGMGVVYQAFDPDLERRVALKVLRADNDDAQKRLLREARAMARLAHPNVITVHEVGTASGRDYVAMELVDGESLAEWLRTEKRAEADILDAFVAAARGLAAAHHAGIVHRDFKPHNVLRSRTGKIAVTDFGLARESQVGVDPMEATARISTKVIAQAGSSSTTSQSKSTPLAGLTMTGSVLGTPAYMAPEQWSGGSVTPATDQFAYCVALWEALSGERPFRGDTVEMLRRAVELGPAPLDDSKLPRKLRAVLRRGLDPVGKQRWESMDALIGAIGRTRRRARPLLIAGPLIGVAGAVALVVKLSSSSAPVAAVADECAPPSIDPATVSLDTSRPEKPALAAMLDRWKTARGKACALPADRRPAVLDCLNGVMVRLSSIVDGVRALPADFDPIDIGGFLIDPVVCELPTTPRLTQKATPELRQSIAMVIYEQANGAPTDLDATDKLIQRVKADPCAVAWAHSLATNNRDGVARTHHLAEADQAAEQCEDDRIKADIAEIATQYALGSNILGTAVTSKLKLAEVAVQRVAQPDLTADIDSLRMAIAARADNFDEAIKRGEAAMAGYRAAGRLAAEIGVGVELLDLHQLRGKPGDDEYVQNQPRIWRQYAVAALGEHHPTVRTLDIATAEIAFSHGDIVDAPAKLAALRKAVPHRSTRKVHGTVVDAAGKPIAGATVSAGRTLVGGGPYAALALSYSGPGMVVTTSSSTGEFDLPASPDSGLIIAQLGDRRSSAAAIEETVKLVLQPTSQIEGKVDLGGERPTRVTIAIEDTRFKGSRYELIAPVRPGGGFVIEGVPRAKLKVYAAVRSGVSSSRSLATVDVDTTNQPIVKGIALAVSNDHRVVHVLVRSTVSSSVINAQVMIFPGTVKSMTLDKLVHADAPPVAIRYAHQIEQERAPAAVVKLARNGDAFASVDQAPKGPASACAIALPDDIADPDLDRKARQHADKIELRCTPVAAGVEAVVVEVPPWPRLD